MTIVEHPTYNTMIDQYNRWRFIEDGGDQFIDTYLYQRGAELATDFTLRTNITWNPGDAASAVRDVQFAMHQRIASEVKRIGGSDTYQNIISGKFGGVDLKNSTMTNFITRQILGELLFMGKVGVYIDAPVVEGNTLADIKEYQHPYLTVYTAENIINWDESNGVYNNLLLKESVTVKNEDGLVEDFMDRYRFLEMTDGKVKATFFDDSGNPIDKDTNLPSEITYPLELTRIPFVMAEISQSLLTNIDRAQITLLNLESGDISWLHRSNLNILTRQTTGHAKFSRNFNDNEDDIDAEATDNADTITIGDTKGIEYDQNTERPDFISPSAEPLRASIEKQDKIREGIERQLNIILRDLTSSSAESKNESKRGMEAGLSAIGAELEHFEALVAMFIDLYAKKTDFAQIKYPEKYELLSDFQRQDKAEKLAKIQHNLPSKTAQIQLLIEQAELIIGHRLSKEQSSLIQKEIEESPGLTSDPNIIADLVEKGIMSKQLGGRLLNLPEDDRIQAEKEHIDRLVAIQIAQTNGEAANLAARGNPDASADPAADAKLEKTASQDPILNPDE